MATTKKTTTKKKIVFAKLKMLKTSKPPKLSSTSKAVAKLPKIPKPTPVSAKMPPKFFDGGKKRYFGK